MIGINTAINAAGQGLGFAIPINQAKKMLVDLKKHGRILRGWLGTLLVTTPAGVYIDGIVLKSAAFQAGLKSGDKVLEVEGQKVEDRMDIERALEEKRAGEDISIVVERDGRLTKRVQTYRIKLGEEPKGAEIPPGLL